MIGTLQNLDRDCYVPVNYAAIVLSLRVFIGVNASYHEQLHG